jgi:ribosomal protein L35
MAEFNAWPANRPHSQRFEMDDYTFFAPVFGLDSLGINFTQHKAATWPFGPSFLYRAFLPLDSASGGTENAGFESSMPHPSPPYTFSDPTYPATIQSRSAPELDICDYSMGQAPLPARSAEDTPLCNETGQTTRRHRTPTAGNRHGDLTAAKRSRNRAAAERYRIKKREQVAQLEARFRHLCDTWATLRERRDKLQDEVFRLKAELLQHAECCEYSGLITEKLIGKGVCGS